VPARARGCGRGECRHPSCTLTPAQEEGPYYLDLDRIRKDITEGKAGLRLDLSSALLRPRRRKSSTIRKGLIASITVGVDPS
jgi:hypothetical protein